tara:strand:+ start:554 stop:787 length:234 start_codon:yes stop_codon:yes gene_type:complete
MSQQEFDQLEKAEDVTEPNTNHEFYRHIRLMVESMEADVLKSERGNKAAATRLRKSLRLLKSTSGDFVKFTLGKLER